MLEELDTVLSGLQEEFAVVLLDDCSTDDTLEKLKRFSFRGRNLSLEILSLDLNRGHQFAIRQGLLYVSEKGGEKAIIMDADGADDPHCIPAMLSIHDADVVRIVRGKRAEPIRFRIAYFFYRLIFRIVLGRRMNFGNFCLINKKVISIISVQPFYHFAAFLSRLPLKSASVTADRRKRVSGKSKMTFRKLFYHAMNSFVEYGEELTGVFMKLTVFLSTLFILFLFLILYLKLFTDKAILGWASTLGVALFSCLLICVGFFVSGILLLRISKNKTISVSDRQYKIL